MAKTIDEFKHYYAKDRKAWRKWLEQNHLTAAGIWLVYYKKDSGKSRVPYAEAVEEALCFGWIDSTLRPGNEEYYIQLFMPRKPKSGWSKINKQRVEKLIEIGLMMPAGLEKIEHAKKNGTWSKLDDIEEIKMPPELKKAFTTNKTAKKFFDSQSPSTRKYMIYWISMTKLPETRAKRINELIEAAVQGRKPDHFNRKPKK